MRFQYFILLFIFITGCDSAPGGKEEEQGLTTINGTWHGLSTKREVNTKKVLFSSFVGQPKCLILDDFFLEDSCLVRDDVGEIKVSTLFESTIEIQVQGDSALTFTSSEAYILEIDKGDASLDLLNSAWVDGAESFFRIIPNDAVFQPFQYKRISGNLYRHSDRDCVVLIEFTSGSSGSGTVELVPPEGENNSCVLNTVSLVQDLLFPAEYYSIFIPPICYTGVYTGTPGRLSGGITSPYLPSSCARTSPAPWPSPSCFEVFSNVNDVCVMTTYVRDGGAVSTSCSCSPG